VFDLWQEPISSDESCDLCFTVGESADIEEVSINGVYGEYVEGVWQLQGEKGYGLWINDRYRKMLVWQADGMAYLIDYTGFPHYMRKDAMIAVAESIPTSQDDSLLDDLTLEEVEALADFDIYQPAQLPEGYSFTKALYDRDTGVVTLMYYYYDQVSPAIGLKIESTSPSEACDICRVVGSSARVQKVSINGAYGEYVEGVWTGEDGEAVWKSYSYYTTLKHLIWQTDEMIFELNYMGSFLNKMDLIEIAESVKIVP
jgi:hypothetical protein